MACALGSDMDPHHRFDGGVSKNAKLETQILPPEAGSVVGRQSINLPGLSLAAIVLIRS